VKFPIKVTNNSDFKYISIKGYAEESSLSITPKKLIFPPTFPYSNGVQCKLSVINYSTFPVEFFCSDYDRQYLYEEAVLRETLQYTKKETEKFIPKRDAGEFLCESLVEDFEKLHFEERKNLDELSVENWVKLQQPRKRKLPNPTPLPEELKESEYSLSEPSSVSNAVTPVTTISNTETLSSFSASTSLETTLVPNALNFTLENQLSFNQGIYFL
jgi:hypothetical protein